MNNIEEFEIAYNKYTNREAGTPVEKFKHSKPGITYKYQHANMLAFWNAARDGVIAQLEAAHKRIAELDNSESQLINERDHAESTINSMFVAVMSEKPEWSNMYQFIDAVDEVEDFVSILKQRAESAEAALSAANEKLSKPVVLPAGYSVRAGHPINESERNVLIPKDGGRWLSRFDVEHALRVAGVAVEGEER
ncbi:hypothetical protein [Yersinia kristensenii]|uniref:Ead/Ea22-like family protein n=1 Tax=Yersinia kristensenii TaxID=28152 RepID=A0AB73PQI8_YERKR|nr:hypothetical protein [Yersinia kristensenii]OVZ82202.1 hypothetical protein CBW52_05175 [Yersinia kristensenii]